MDGVLACTMKLSTEDVHGRRLLVSFYIKSGGHLPAFTIAPNDKAKKQAHKC